MTVYSARELYEKIGSNQAKGYCVPLALDSIMHRTELPLEWYERAYETHYSRESDAGPNYIKSLITDFFKSGFEYDDTTANSPIANFSAFGASAQPYCPDVPYEYTNEDDITDRQQRLVRLLNQANALRCMVLFNVPAKNFHMASLQVVDPGGHLAGVPYGQRYVIRDNGLPVGNRLYSVEEVAGVYESPNYPGKGHVPLPETAMPWFPYKQSSWNLMILPPEPKV